jgi:hypothetical protein
MIIYKTTNLVNGKIYIGKDVKNNPDYLGSGLILKNAINKYGKENFIKEVLETCSTQIELNEKEVFWIEKLRATDKTIGYNIAPGGRGGNIYFHLPEEIQQKIKTSVANSNKTRPKLFGSANKSYRAIDMTTKDIILTLSRTMGRDKIYKTITEMGIQCLPPRTLARRLNEWKAV